MQIGVKEGIELGLAAWEPCARVSSAYTDHVIAAERDHIKVAVVGHLPDVYQVLVEIVVPALCCCRLAICAGFLCGALAARP
mgnify:CR=1 FL=1